MSQLAANTHPGSARAGGILSPQPPPNGYLVSKPYAWYVFALLLALMAFDFMDRQIITSLFPYFKQEWGISDTQCGFLVAVVNWSITSFALPVAWLADRWSRKKTVGLMSSIWSLATLACAFTTNYTQLIVARSAIGVGEAGYIPAGTALISALFPQRIRGALIGVFLGAGSLGSALGVMLGGWVATRFGWRHAFGVVAIPGLVLAILFFFIRDYKTVDLAVSAAKSDGTTGKRAMTRKEILNILLGTPSLICIYLGNIIAMSFVGVIANWLPAFFMRESHMSIAEASTRAGLVLLFSMIGNYMGGMLADKFSAWGWRRPTTAALLQLASGVVFLSAFGLARGQSQMVLLGLGGLLFTAFNGPVYSSLVELVHPGLRSTVVSVMTLLQNVLGFAVGSIAAGIISDHYGIGVALLALSIVPLLSMGLFLLGATFYARDVAKVEHVEIQMEA